MLGRNSSLIFTVRMGIVPKIVKCVVSVWSVKQPGHFQRNCPVQHQRLLRPDEDAEALPDVESSVVPQAGSLFGAGSLVSGHLNLPVGSSSVPPPPVASPDGAGSPAASQSIPAAVFKSAGEIADGAGSHMDTRDNQLDELNSQVYVSQSASQSVRSLWWVNWRCTKFSRFFVLGTNPKFCCWS